MKPYSHATNLRQAISLLESGRIAEAESITHRLAAQSKKNPLVHALLGQIAEAKGRLEVAARHYQKCIALDPKQAMAYIALGQLRTSQGQFKEAISSHHKALKLAPGLPNAIAALADAYSKQGDYDSSLKTIQPFIDKEEDTPHMAVVYATVSLNLRRHDEAIRTASRHLDNENLDPNNRQLLGYVLGRALESLDCHDKAFEAYRQANDVYPSCFNETSYTRKIDDLIMVFSTTNLARLPRATNSTELPIFIAGMPRSGTTLIERIIDAHPRARGAGEINVLHDIIQSMPADILSDQVYPRCVLDLTQEDVNRLSRAYLEGLRPYQRGVDRVVDKNLFNYQHLGLISILFPKAKIIHCRRDPMDTCFSCFTASLSNITHPWACDLTAIGLAFRQYERLMDHWREALNQPILKVQYETLVDDQIAQSHRIIEFVGLDWDERCLRFHETTKDAKRAGIAPTLSYDQVRRPVYRSSCGRWKPFKSHLGPLIEALGLGTDLESSQAEPI